MKKLLLCLLLVFTLVGCNKEKAPTYDYSFIDYINVEVAGPDGFAKLYLTVKDFDATSFKTEKDYIELKKTMPSIFENLVVSKNSNLSNGEMVQIGIKEDFVYEGTVNIDLNPKSFEIKGLTKPETLDLFKNENVIFYGLENTDKVYYYFPSTSKIPLEARKHLKYDFKIDEKEVSANKTIVTASAVLDDELLLSDKRYTSINDYFLVKGFVPQTSGEFILKEVVKENDFETMNKETVEKQINNALKEKQEKINDYEFQNVLKIQKTEKNPFEYIIIADYKQLDEVITVVLKAKITSVDNEIQLDEVSYIGKQSEKENEYKEIFKFDKIELSEDEKPEVSTENKTEDKEGTDK